MILRCTTREITHLYYENYVDAYTYTDTETHALTETKTPEIR